MARPRKSEATRRRLLDEGVAAFLVDGFHGSGLKTILDRCGVPKGSFYNYFASKEEYGAAVIGHYAEGVRERLQRVVGGAASSLDGLEALFREDMKTFSERNYTGGCLVANLGGELEGSDVCREALKRAFDGWRDAVADVLDKARTEGVVRGDIPPRELASSLTEAWEGSVIRMKIDRSLEPLERCLDLFFRHWLLGPSHELRATRR